MLHSTEVEECADQSGAGAMHAAVDVVSIDRLPAYIGRKVRCSGCGRRSRSRDSGGGCRALGNG